MLVESKIPTAVLVRSNASCRKLVQLLSQVEVFCGDMHDESVLAGALQDFRPDTILHLGWTGVASGNRNETSQLSNLQTSIKLIQLAKNLGVSTIVALGSQAEYGPKEIAIDEQSACAPTTMYGAVKLASSTIGIQLCKLNEIRFVWLRLFSCFGPGDHSGAMIPSLIATLLAGEKPSLTSARQNWDYLYVDDAARAVIHSAVNSELQGIFNLGSGNAVELRQIIECIRDQIDSSLPLGFGEMEQNPDAPKHLEANIGKLVASGWKPDTSLLEGIKTTIEWVKKEVKQ
jgi:nucleoside-diphosphate-sugar epimerase